MSNNDVIIQTFRREVCSIPKTQTAFINYFLLDMFDAWHEFCDVAIVRDQLKENLKFWDEMDSKGLTTIEVSELFSARQHRERAH